MKTEAKTTTKTTSNEHEHDDDADEIHEEDGSWAINEESVEEDDTVISSRKDPDVSAAGYLFC